MTGKNSLVLATVLGGLLLFTALKPSYAAVRCETQYGGGQTCVSTGQLQVSKSVFNPDSSQFVNNLGLSGHLFSAGETVTFQITVKNTGDATFSTVTVTDTLPSFLQLTSGNLNYTINNLGAGQSNTQQIQAKVVPASQLPADKTTICLVNSVSGLTNDNQQDNAASQFCIQNKVLGVTTLPPTGPNYGLIFLTGSVLLAGVGVSLSKFSK